MTTLPETAQDLAWAVAARVIFDRPQRFLEQPWKGTAGAFPGLNTHQATASMYKLCAAQEGLSRPHMMGSIE